MPVRARTFPSFADGLRISYEEEIAGEAFFTVLARHQPPFNRQVLLMFAGIERLTHASLAPLIRKHRIETGDEKALKRDGAAEAESHVGKSWDDVVARMIETYPVFIEEFRGLRDLAPVEDAAEIDILIEHEQAMLDFALLYRARDANPMKPLEDFVRRQTLRPPPRREFPPPP